MIGSIPGGEVYNSLHYFYNGLHAELPAGILLTAYWMLPDSLGRQTFAAMLLALVLSAVLVAFRRCKVLVIIQSNLACLCFIQNEQSLFVRPQV